MEHVHQVESLMCAYIEHLDAHTICCKHQKFAIQHHTPHTQDYRRNQAVVVVSNVKILHEMTYFAARCFVHLMDILILDLINVNSFWYALPYTIWIFASHHHRNHNNYADNLSENRKRSTTDGFDVEVCAILCPLVWQLIKFWVNVKHLKLLNLLTTSFNRIHFENLFLLILERKTKEYVCGLNFIYLCHLKNQIDFQYYYLLFFQRNKYNGLCVSFFCFAFVFWWVCVFLFCCWAFRFCAFCFWAISFC